MTRSTVSRRQVNLLLSLLAASLLMPSRPALGASEADFLSATKDFDAAQAGDAAALQRAADAFEALLRAQPGNPVLLAYSGAGHRAQLPVHRRRPPHRR